MTNGIGFGTLVTTGGSPRLVATNSKLDTEALVAAAYQAKRQPAVRLEARIARNEAKLAAFAELRDLLSELRAATNGLRNPPGLSGRAENLFEAKQAYLVAGGTSDPRSVLGVSLTPTAAAGSFEVEVERVASAHKLQLRGAGAVDQPLAEAWNGGASFSGSLEIGLAGGPKATIAIDGQTTLAGLRAAIEARSQQTGVSATIVKVAEGDVRLVLTARETAKAIEFGDLGPDPLLPLVDPSDLVAPRTARIRVDGVALERPTNRIDDVLPGVTLDLFQARPGEPITVTVEPDLAGVKRQLGRFVDAYNAVRDFLARHSRVAEDGTVPADAVLFGDRTLRDVTRALSREMGGRAFGLDPAALGTLRDVGIELVEGGKLRIDERKLDRMLLERLDTVRDVFEFRARASSPELAVFNRGNALVSSRFDVVIVDEDGDGVPEAATIGGVPATVSGRRILGAAGSPFEGLELAWIGSGSTTIGLDVSQGVADRVFNVLDRALAVGRGQLDRATTELGGANDTLRREITRIEERAERARAALVEKFTRMETALGLANTLLGQVRAQMDAAFARS